MVLEQGAKPGTSSPLPERPRSCVLRSESLAYSATGPRRDWCKLSPRARSFLGDLIRAQLTPQGYREMSRAHLLEPTSPFASRKCAQTPPTYANHHVFARNDAELVCASLAAKP